MSDIGIIIVTYNSAAEIGACLDAALASGANVVVVDNASRDGTIAEVARRGVRLIANGENRGFAAAVNQGFQVLSSPYVLLLNPDAILQSSLEPLRQACNLPGSAGAGGRLVDLEGRPQLGFMVRRLPTPAALALEALLLNRVWPNNPVNRRYRALDLDPDRPSAVEQPAGAFLMVRRKVWEQLGGFDEEFRPGLRMWISAGAPWIRVMASTTRRELLRNIRAGTLSRSYRWRCAAFIGMVVF
ncbi:hypothetical protein SBA3_960004 [Candidatus Sulfopaludibacter sp. SbA3]|nr:hypothetical protein SBA3_960004 [Candidatus Sulfopaludibacter sp. SbA3]